MSLARKSCVIVGDPLSKRKLLMMKLNPKTRQIVNHEPLIVEEFSRSHPKFNFIVDFVSIDGNEYNSPILGKIYGNASVFVVCFSVISEESFNSAVGKWVNEIKEVKGNDAHIIIVGTECDKRNDDTKEVISYEDAIVAIRDKCWAYHECSIEHGDGIETLAEEIFRAAEVSAFAYEKSRKSSTLFERIRKSISRNSNA
jgi:GTPase SAR1 family protein